MSKMDNNDLSGIASPSGKVMESFIDDSITSMNETFFLPRITQNDESLLSPEVHSPAPSNIADLGISVNVFNAIRGRVLQDMQATFNSKAVEFFQQFEERLENIVDLKLNNTNYKKSLLQHIEGKKSSQNDMQSLELSLKKFDEHYEDFVDKYDKFNLVNDKLQTAEETLTDKIESVRADITRLDNNLKNLQMSTDEEIAKKIQNPTSAADSNNLEVRVRSLESQNEQLSVQLDKVEQYNRQYILNFKNIVNHGTREQPERATDLIINFLWVRLGIDITNRDISICHRQDIPSERKALGKKYIAPIYCKFLHRSLVHEILNRKHFLRNTRNEFNEPYEIEQNLTPNRRLLWNSVEEKLAHFRFKWVKRGGDICVKEQANSKVVKVISERVLDELVAKHPAPEITPSIPNGPPQRNFHVSSTRNRYCDVVDNHASSYRRTRPYHVSRNFQLHSTNAPLFTFKNKSFVNYRSSAY